MFAPEPDTFTPAPEGSHIAVLIRFIDLGSAASPFDNIIRRRIRLGFETAHEFMPDGRPFIVSKTVNLSLRQGSNLRSIAEALLGRKLTKADVSNTTRIASGLMLSLDWPAGLLLSIKKTKPAARGQTPIASPSCFRGNAKKCPPRSIPR